jgi:acyl transferase domain-containing protein
LGTCTISQSRSLSAKTHPFSHLEITSFLASLSKVLSIFRTGEVPPQANLKNLNQAIHWEEFNMRVPRSKETISARHPSGKMLTAICSSGIGGVNAHAVIESHPAPNTVQPAVDGPVLLLAAGLSPRSTSAIADDIKSVVAETPYRVADFSVIYGRRARQMTWRSFAVRKPGQATFDFSAPVLGPRVKPPVVFLFSGQGPQHINSECIRTTLKRCRG